jgi:hypothetical protein
MFNELQGKKCCNKLIMNTAYKLKQNTDVYKISRIIYRAHLSEAIRPA